MTAFTQVDAGAIRKWHGRGRSAAARSAESRLGQRGETRHPVGRVPLPPRGHCDCALLVGHAAHNRSLSRTSTSVMPQASIARTVRHTKSAALARSLAGPVSDSLRSPCIVSPIPRINQLRPQLHDRDPPVKVIHPVNREFLHKPQLRTRTFPGKPQIRPNRVVVNRVVNAVFHHKPRLIIRHK